MPTVPTFIELLTWNDLGECHYLGPFRANAGLPQGTISSSTYVDGASYAPMIPLIKILSAYYTSGSFPTITSASTQARLRLWTRCPSLATTSPPQVFFIGTAPRPRRPSRPTTPLPAPANIAWTDDNIYAAIVVGEKSSARKFTIKSGTASVTSSVLKGTINLVKLPFQVGTPTFAVFNSATKALGSVSGPAIVASLPVYDLNCLSGSFNATH